MIKKIIISSAEVITCPKCSHQFPISECISKQTVQRYETEYEQLFSDQRRELEESLTQELEKKAAQTYNDQITKLQQQITAQVETLKQAELDTQTQIAKAKEDAKAKAIQEMALEKASLLAEVEEKDTKIKDFIEKELQLRKQKKDLDDKQAAFELDIQRRLDEERAALIEQITSRESEQSKLREAELNKKIEDMQTALEEARRKAAQGSQQLQGEVLELELEHTLSANFYHDLIDEVKKGQRGADVLQTVRTVSGIECGKIVWEAKRAENWTEKWLQKLKDDQLEAKADIAVLVTTAMPKGTSEMFAQIGDVWVIPPHLIKPVAEMLREVLLQVQKVKQINTGKNEKMEMLYNYLASAQFAQKVRTMLESFESMRSDLEAEKRAITRAWAKREQQILRLTGSMTSVVGELQGIAHEALPQLETIDPFMIDDDENSEDIGINQ